MKVAVCVATYHRPDLLSELLATLVTLDVSTVEIVVVIVDNDPSGSAAKVVDTFRSSIGHLVYDIEPKPGISAVRNRLVRQALEAECAYVAFVDDDETVTQRWLDELIGAAVRFQADVVTGPVIPRYAPSVPQWVIHGKFFERPRHMSGQVLDVARTGNVLIKCAWLATPAGPFNDSFGLTGGEDTDLFQRLHGQGARIVWSDEAVVYEIVPLGRARVSWLMQRAFRGGNGFAETQTAPRLRLVALAKGVAHIAFGVVGLLLGVFLGTAQCVTGLCRVARGMGAVLGVVGYRYEEYRHVAQ